MYYYCDAVAKSSSEDMMAITKRKLKKDQVVARIIWESISEISSRHSIQRKYKDHRIPESPFYYLNHSCNPNCYITEDDHLVALKDIEKDGELTIFYPATEWRLSNPFECRCGSKNCIMIVRGAPSIFKNNLYRTEDYKVSSFIKEELRRFYFRR